MFLSKLLISCSLFFVKVRGQDATNDQFYLAENSVTILCPDASVGDQGVVRGTTYTKRTASQITTSNAGDTCTSGITDMSYLFDGSFNFFQGLEHWDTSQVTSMAHMFERAFNFNGKIDNWDTSKVSTMLHMFDGAFNFNQNIGAWNTSQVVDMAYMFDGAFNFNGDIGDWDTSRVESMDSMFFRAVNFNRDLSAWCVENITSEPSGFATGSQLAESLKPNWGAPCA